MTRLNEDFRGYSHINSIQVKEIWMLALSLEFHVVLCNSILCITHQGNALLEHRGSKHANSEANHCQGSIPK